MIRVRYREWLFWGREGVLAGTMYYWGRSVFLIERPDGTFTTRSIHRVRKLPQEVVHNGQAH